MSIGVLTLFLLDFAFIASLPVIFFRRGVFNLLWLATGAPYFAAAVSMLLSYAGVLSPLRGISLGGYVGSVQECLGVACCTASMTLMGFVLGTHQKPLRLWLQQDDKTEHLVTHGAYARIRHPFYSSFLLALAGAFLVAPSVGTAVTFGYGIVVMTLTARKEEAGLLASDFGREYAVYMRRTGRFFPFLGTQPPLLPPVTSLSETQDG
jgi:protein-S-isoprenylcysteine O-methyltransferase Ste14